MTKEILAFFANILQKQAVKKLIKNKHGEDFANNLIKTLKTP